MSDMISDYTQIGRVCVSRVTNPILVGELKQRMEDRDGNMLVVMFDDLSACILDNMPMFANSEIGTYRGAMDGFIEDDGCYEIIARTILDAADVEMGYEGSRSSLVQWMRWMFLSE